MFQFNVGVEMKSFRSGITTLFSGEARRTRAASVRMSEIRFRRLFEAARDGVLIVDPTSRVIVEANPFMTELLGYSRLELLGKELWEIGLLKDREASQAAFRELQERGYIRYQDLPLESKRGDVREVEFVSNVYREGSDEVIQCNIRDVTERKRTEVEQRGHQDRMAVHTAELEQLVNERTAALRESVRELEAFSYSIAHDMRAPLRAMHGFAKLVLAEHADGISSQGSNYLERIATSAERLDALIQDALNYTRVMRTQASLARIDLDSLVRDIIGSYPDWQPPKAEIEVDGVLPAVVGNTALLTQCVSHLIRNAVKFVGRGVTPRITIQAQPRDEHVRLWIIDNGIGIASENHLRVFRMFERLYPSAEYEGTGIGLTIVRKAVERMGGQVGFESELNQGSRFWLELWQAPE